ncbi:hypothetical protein ACFQT0_27045 [Hymenobacter humi]|uniref:Uncharacterized protein n=1 Tax=Hymenobacter humi TaxID=1411620 RepID=A0ABW2UEI3_9BACT
MSAMATAPLWCSSIMWAKSWSVLPFIFMALILRIMSFIDAIRGESPAALPSAILEWSMLAMSPEAVASVAVVSVVVVVVSAVLSLLHEATSRVPEQRAARKKADFFMGFGMVEGWEKELMRCLGLSWRPGPSR